MTCPAGERGSGGTCNCSEAKGWKEDDEWKTPWCFEGICYSGQDYEECKHKDYSTKDNYPLNDGTWCHKGERNTECPTSSGNVIFAAYHFFPIFIYNSY